MSEPEDLEVEKISRIEGKRLILTEIVPEYFITTLGWLKDKKLRRELAITKYPYSEKEQIEWYENYKKDRSKLIYVALLKSGHVPIGQIGFNRIDWEYQNGEMHIFVGEEKHRSKGYSREMLNIFLEVAFDRLNLNKVWLKVNDDNTRAITFYENMGFTREGLLKRHELHEGQFLNKVILSCFRPNGL
jgi:RimJ/RimL family protein N-acetyltransferase